MKTNKRKTGFQRWKMMLVMALLCLGAGQAMAQRATKIVNIHIDPPEGGSIVYNNNTYGDGSTVILNSSLIFTATFSARNASDYGFVKWEHSSTGGTWMPLTSNSTIMLTSTNTNAVSLTAKFGRKRLLTVNVNPSGHGSVGGNGQVTAGTTATLTATAGTDYTFVSWTNSQGVVVSTNNPYSFTMPDNNLELTANFEPTEYYMLTLTANPTEYGTVSGGGTKPMLTNTTVPPILRNTARCLVVAQSRC